MIPTPSQLVLAAGLITSATSETPQPRCRCAYGDACWPDSQTWDSFNTTVGGGLIRTLPPAAVCHTEHYNAAKCGIAKESWLDSFWRTNQSGAYAAITWEMGHTGQCGIDTPTQARCDQGIVPYYSVDARSVEHIQQTIKFASLRDLFLVTKNTGHDHLGRSSGTGALSIWTHNLKGIKWHDSFVPRDAPKSLQGVPAVTLQAGEQWFDVYQAAAQRGVIVVGGSARTVGAAGGYLLGGGHSPFAHFHGLAADNLLEASIVSADGQHRVVNAFSDPDYFWAIRGGGGSAWGVITSVTYRTHAVPNNLLIALVQLNASSEAAYKHVISESLKLLPAVTDEGYTGYGALTDGFAAFLLRPNTTVESFNQTFAQFFPLAQSPGVSGVVAAYPSSWDGYVETFLRDPNIGTNIQDTSRLLTTDVLQDKVEDLAQFIFDHRKDAGFNYIGKVNNDQRDDTAVHEIWKRSHALLSIGTDWKDNATDCEKAMKRHRMVRLSEQFTDIVGEDGGTYVNEANPYEPEWEKVFWGAKYDRLLSIKDRVDPTKLFVCNRCVGTDIVLAP